MALVLDPKLDFQPFGNSRSGFGSSKNWNHIQEVSRQNKALWTRKFTLADLQKESGEELCYYVVRFIKNRLERHLKLVGYLDLTGHMRGLSRSGPAWGLRTWLPH